MKIRTKSVLDNIELVVILLLCFLSITISVTGSQGITIGNRKIPISLSENSIEALEAAILGILAVSLLRDRTTRDKLSALIETNLPESKPLAVRHYTNTVSNLLRECNGDIFLVMRTGKILNDCFGDFKDAIQRGCSIRVILQDQNSQMSLVRSIAQESESSLNEITGKFTLGNSAKDKLLRLSKDAKTLGSFEIEISKDYLTSQLIFLSSSRSSKERKGTLFAVPLLYKSDPRKDRSILVQRAQELEMFEHYKDRLNALWEDIRVDKIFDSSFSVEQEALLRVDEICPLSTTDRLKMYEIFRRWGFVVVRPSTLGSFYHELMEIKKCFGIDSPHIRSDGESGISTISIESGFPKHFGTTNLETGLHTDGTYSEKSPKIVIHQCENPSEVGGTSQIASCRRVYREIVEQHSKELIELLSPPNKTFSIRRENDSNATSVFKEGEDGKIETTFRSNFSTTDPADFSHPSDKHEEAFEVFSAIVHREDSVLSFKMKSHDILILDNTSVLHGRTEFPKDSNRKLNRLLLDGNIEFSSKVLNIGFNP